MDTPLQIDTKIANALPSSQRSLLAGTPASRRSRGPRPTRRCWPHTPQTPRSRPARPRSRAPSTQSSRSSQPCSFPAAAELLTRRPGSWELVRGSNVVRNLHFVAPLSAALANGDDTLSITADCYSTAGTDAAITAALLAYYTSAQVDALLGYTEPKRRRTRRRPAPSQQRCWTRLPHSKRAGHADAGRHRGRAAGLPDGPGPGRLHNQPNHLGAGGVPLSRRPGHGDGLEHRRRAAQLLHHRTSRWPPRRQAWSRGGSLGAADSRALSGRRRGRRGGGRHRRADPGPHGRLAVKLAPAAAAAWSWPRTPRAQ